MSPPARGEHDQSSEGKDENSSKDITYRQVNLVQPLELVGPFAAAEVLCIVLLQYRGEEDLHLVRGLVDVELSEPYSIFTYRWANIVSLMYPVSGMLQFTSAIY